MRAALLEDGTIELFDSDSDSVCSDDAVETTSTSSEPGDRSSADGGLLQQLEALTVTDSRVAQGGMFL